jgi:citrate lyase subunit beta/citryl-CoA lyase
MTARSCLFVPGDRPERFAKALASGAHAVIVDLEDAVAPARKDEARRLLDAWLRGAAQPVYVRINPAGSAWHEEDLAVLRHEAVRGCMLPKSEDAASLARVAAVLQGGQHLLPLVETVAGWFAAAAIAAAPRVHRLVFGSLDFLADSGIQADGPELDPVRLQLVLESRRAGLPAPVDGVTVALQDPAQLERDALRARSLGFGGKLCVHPSQVPGVNAAFRPTEAQADWARRVIAALAAGPAGAVAVDGKLVDRPVEAQARAILRERDGHA